MKKKVGLIVTTAAVTSLAIAALVFAPKLAKQVVKGDDSYTMLIDGSTEIVEKETGVLYQATIKENVFDFVGYTPVEGKVGSFKLTYFGGEGYHGMIYNRSIINGLTSLKVTYTGDTLLYIFTSFLMEDVDLIDYEPLVSGNTYTAPAGAGYFVIVRNGSAVATIDEIEITYACQGNLDAEMLYNRTSSLGNARSAAKKVTFSDSYLELENNPTATTNNYSTGSHGGNADSWYRWNGKYFPKSQNLGTDFTFAMTIMGEYSRMIDESKFFHYNVWPQFGWMNGDTNMANNNSYAQIYIGNDNYEPLGKDHALHPSDPYVDESYTGRFFTDYGWYNDTWMFANPDTTYLKNGLTMRQAYEEYNLPFWFVKFHVYLDTVDEQANTPVCDIYINNMLIIEQQEIFDTYDYVNTPTIFINTLPMHLVNYGIDAAGTPGESYTGCFTYPRLITA